MNSNAISDSLNNRHVLSVCYTPAEGPDPFHGQLYELRKSFFTGGMNRISLRRQIEENGCRGRVRGSISKHSLHWKKSIGKIACEEAFLVNNSYVVVKRSLNGTINGKIYYDKNQRWVKTEYFSADDHIAAATIIKPVDTMDAVELFTYETAAKNYSSRILYPAPYAHRSAQQSLIDAQAGPCLLLVAAADGEYCYCPPEESEKRMALDGTAGGISSEPVMDGNADEAESDPPEEEPRFKNLYTPASTEPKEQSEPAAASQPGDELLTQGVSKAREDSAAGTLTGEDLTLTVESTSVKVKKAPIVSGGVTYNYTGTLIDGKREGRGRTDQKGGLTAFDGEYRDNRKNGFGCSYYKNGNLSYAGGWKDDKKHGIGASFRSNDHAVQVCRWEEGIPGGFTTVFNNDGSLKYSGRMSGGKRNGVGVSTREESLFVGVWEDGKLTDRGALFDAGGRLIYTGQWKDGKRCGFGTEFDADGNIVYTGLWEDDAYAGGTLYKKI